MTWNGDDNGHRKQVWALIAALVGALVLLVEALTRGLRE